MMRRAIRLHRKLQRLDAFHTPYKQWDHHVREHHYIAQRQQGQTQHLAAGSDFFWLQT